MIEKTRTEGRNCSGDLRNLRVDEEDVPIREQFRQLVDEGVEVAGLDTTARRHFFAHGFRSVTMDDLADELGMSKESGELRE